MQKLSDVNVSKGRIKEHFIKRFSGRLEGLESYKNVFKIQEIKGGGGGRGPLGPFPKSAYEKQITLSFG